MHPRAAALILLLFLLTNCASEQRTIALNWYARIDHAPGCGEQSVALIAGKDTLLCPIDRAIYSGDTLVATSGSVCYFIDLQAITDYKSKSDLTAIDCADFDGFIRMAETTGRFGMEDRDTNR